jgi:hypothetical protein
MELEFGIHLPLLISLNHFGGMKVFEAINVHEVSPVII